MAQRKFIVLTLGAVLVATAAMQAYVFVYQGSLAALIGQANSLPGVDSYCFNPEDPSSTCSGFSGVPSGWDCHATYSACENARGQSGSSSSSGEGTDAGTDGGSTAGTDAGTDGGSTSGTDSGTDGGATSGTDGGSGGSSSESNDSSSSAASSESTSSEASVSSSASSSASAGSSESAASSAASQDPPAGPACGDGNEDEGEGCDDGNTEDGDGCSAACTDEDLCGNTQPDEGEECDDGNDDDNDACNNNCTINECNDGIDNNNNGVMDAGEPECYTPTNTELLDDEIYHPDDPNYPGNSSPGDEEQIGFFRAFFRNLFARLKAFLIGQAGPVFMPGNAEGDLCAGQPIVDPDNGLPLGPNPNPVAGFNPHESPFHCWISGGVNWAGQCGTGCRCADGSAFLNGACVSTSCTGACAEEQQEVNCTNCCDAPTVTPEQPEPEEPSAIEPACVPTRMVFTENIVQGAGIAYYAGDPVPPVSTVTPGLNPEEGQFHCYVSGGIAWAPNCGTNKCQCPTGVANFSAPCNDPEIAAEAGGYDEEAAEEAEPDTCNACANSCVQEDEEGNQCPSLHGSLNCLIGSPQCCANGEWRCPNGVTGESNCDVTLEPEANGCTPLEGSLNCFIGSPACCPSQDKWICPNGITGEYNCDVATLNESDSTAASSAASSVQCEEPEIDEGISSAGASAPSGDLTLCNSPDACPSGQVCYKFRCIPDECDANADCGSGQICVENQCMAGEACDDPLNCPGPSHEYTFQECTTDADCTPELCSSCQQTDQYGCIKKCGVAKCSDEGFCTESAYVSCTADEPSINCEFPSSSASSAAQNECSVDDAPDPDPDPVFASSASSQSASAQSCTTDTDCQASCSTCDIIPGYGCGKKCHNLICTNGFCGGGQQYVFCASNACPDSGGSSSTSSESNGIGTGGTTGNNNNANGTSSSRSSAVGSPNSSSAPGNGGNNGTASSAGSSLAPGSCSNDSQCPFGDYCIGGTCKECVSNVDCPAGDRCQNNTCVDDDDDNGTGGSTTGFGSCTFDECRDGGTDYCIAKGATGCRQIAGAPCIECTDSVDNVTDNRPLNGACTNTECRDGGDFFCAQNGADGCVQIAGAPCIQCGNDTDNDGILDEFITPEDPAEVAFANECSNDAECPEGPCMDGRCTQTQCRNDFDCPAGLCMNGWCSLECSNDAECTTGLCSGGRCEQCEADEQCSTNRCVSGRCSACTNDDQCSFGVCSAGICSECASDAHCANGERCVGNRCLESRLVAALPSYCGNGRVDPGEACDDGSGNSDLPGGLCRTDCRSGRCGDNIPDMPLESCDDGNMFDGDGCSSSCQLERTAPQTLPATVVELPFVPEMSDGGAGGAIGGMVNPDGTTVAANVGTIGQGGVEHPPATADTGPAAIAVMAAGAAAGYAYVRRKKV